MKNNNTKYKGSMSLLSAISSEGLSFTAIFTWTIISIDFIQFLENLFRYIEKFEAQTIRQTIIIMDNVPYQKSKLVQKVLREWKVNVFYLPPYSPELAPIELLFRSLKAKLKRRKEQMNISFNSQEGIYVVCKALKSIKPKEILGYWPNFYWEIKRSLEFIRLNT